MTVDVAIIGGGVSGLATAYALRRRGHKVMVLERQVRVGGNALSERFDGFLMEHGPSSMNGTMPEAAGWSRDLGLDRQQVELGADVRRRYLTHKGGLRGIAVHPLGFLMSAYLSPWARLRVLAEAALPRRRGGGEETVAEFARRRFGAEFAERVIDPLIGGMFAGRAAELSVSAVLPRLVEMERRHGSIGRAVLWSRARGGAMPGRRLFSWREGIGALPAMLASRLGSSVRTGFAVRRIVPSGHGYRIEAGARGTVTARAVVIATQSHVTAGLLEGTDPEGALAAAAIDAPPLAVVFLGYRRRQISHPLDGLGYLTPESEGRALTGALFCSTMFPGRAPEGHVAVAGYVGGARAPDRATLPARELVALAHGEFRDLLGARGEPMVARVRQWPRGLPQYRPGHGERVAALLSLDQRRPGLFATGNFLAGPSVAACLAQAGETACRVERHLGLPERQPQANATA